MTGSILLSIALLMSAPADTLRIGDPSLHVLLAAGTDTVDNYVVQGGERRPLGTSIETRSEIPEGFLIVQENRGADGTLFSLDSIVVADRTLATVWHGDVTPTGRRHVVFSDGRMTGVAVDTLGQETSLDAEVPPGLLDYSVFALVANYLPMSPGYNAVVATYDIARGAIYVPLEVVAAEDVTLGGTTLEAWRMEIHLGARSVTRWIERETRREIKWSVAVGDAEMVGERRND
ncbi:MAG: hypothetical protein PVJ02_09580 [Gemmatimonadota bacterium]|jgi:hypothetical protein